ncbi:TolC family protein [Prevotella sp. P6B1]|uniref:TolC family protein n=1 Tax=Prevotella sp. P6B1 TaxID=1410613 RepID=UPI00051AD719|nr:TolC family protein [Prevotella sp. P6B1]
MKRFLLFCTSASLCFSTSLAQSFNMQQCMQYAVQHNHEVKQAELELDNYKASKTGAIGKFLPYVDAGIGAQYNFGRAIDPETNGYTDVSTFYNGYQLSASLPIFDGFSRLHALKAAKASELMGRASLRQRQDQTALDVLQAYTSVAYYDGLVKMAAEKVEETLLLLKQVKVLEEVGRKSAADVAQVESQQAEADYELTRQQNLYASAILELKKAMNYPLSDSLSLEYIPNVGMFGSQCGNNSFPTWEQNLDNERHPELQVARYRMQTSKHEWHQARASLYPSLSLSAGLSTTYYKTLHNDAAETFRNQLKNNMGEYLGVSVSIPLFNRLQTLTSIRKAKNNYKIAQEAYDQKQLELTKLSSEAWNDWQGYQKQTIQMEKKVQADSLSYQLTRRQFEEGLSTAIDVHTTSAQLLNSKATLLQCQLMAMVKEQLVRYYKGETIWTE